MYKRQVVNDSLVGYLEGAAYVNPDIKAVVSYTGNWDDSAKGKELALVQYNAGADIVFQLASNAGVGVFEAAKETGNLAIGCLLYTSRSSSIIHLNSRWVCRA